jgi:hypothetical protein
MAFTQGFENDVFISYSHRDNLAPRWVDHFHDALLAALKRKLGDDHVVLWRDAELNANSLFNQKIKRMIDSSAYWISYGKIRFDRYKRRLRHWRMRRLYGPGRQQSSQFLPYFSRASQWLRYNDHRRTGKK